MKGTLALAVSMMLIVALVCGCNSKEDAVTAEDLPAILVDLMAEEIMVNNIYLGDLEIESIDWRALKEEGKPPYARITDKRFNTVGELKALTQKVFTEEYAERRYYKSLLNRDEPLFKDMEGGIYLHTGMALVGGHEWVPTSLKIATETEEAFVVKMDFKSAADADISTATLTLKKMGDGSVRIDDIVE